ncbi:MAG TPA: DUF167 domain-containing protein [Candidatus Limnocylindria bacterium]|nr:DUF167 domain-containing protein [Candidatus Limnocylindria bacterium]
MLAIRRDGDRVSFNVRVIPRSARSAIGGERDGALVVRVTAPPVEGRANEAVTALLAEALRLPRSAVRVERGATGRTKLLSVPRGALAALQRLAK